MMQSYICFQHLSEIPDLGEMPISFILSAKSLLSILIVICMDFCGCYLLLRHGTFYIFPFSTKTYRMLKITCVLSIYHKENQLQTDEC